MSHKNQNYEKTRTDLIDAFLRLYEKSSLLKISVADVCREAGYHRSTFYHHFSSLEDIASKLKIELLAESAREFRQSGHKESSETSNLLFLNKDSFLKYNVLFSRMLFDEQLNNYVKNYAENVAEQIRESFGENFKLPESRLSVILTYALAGNVAVYKYWRQHQDSLDEEEMIELLDQLANKGVRGLIFSDSGKSS